MLSQTILVPALGTNPSFTAVQTYTYDQLNRIQDAKENINGSQTPEWKQTFKYDRYGNRTFNEAETTTLTKQCVENSVPAVCEAHRKHENPVIDTTNNNNRLKEYQDGDGVKDYEYDTAGNTKKDASGKIFTYDGENKQVKVESGGSVIGEYWYDGDGKRVKKRGFYNSQWEETIFVYDASGRLVAEYSNQVATAEYAQVSYLTNDHLGSPRITTNKDGGVISRRDFMPFGEEISTAQRTAGLGYTADTVRQKFTGYERDSESSLDFAQARMHNYNHGRFTSPDPLMSSAKVKNPQTFNRYSYVLNNPINLIDPLGLSPGCPEGKKCEKDDDGNEYYTEDGIRIYVGGDVGAVTVNAEDTPVTPGYVFPVVPEKVVEKLPWWKKYITRPIGNGAKTVGKTLVKGGGAILIILTSAPSTGCGASPGMVSDGNGGCMKNPTRVDQDTGTENKDDTDEDDKSPVFVRFGPGPETLDGLRTQAEAAESSGYPYGVSVFLLTPPIRATGARQAPVPEANGAFEVRRTGTRPNHYTVIFPKPLTQDTVNLFNTVFRPR